MNENNKAKSYDGNGGSCFEEQQHVARVMYLCVTTTGIHE